MGVKVAKFGGTSLADATMMKQVKAIVEADSSRRYVVPSAPGKRTKTDQKITDLLYLCHEHVVQQLPFEDVFKVIAERYLEIVRDLGLKLDMNKHLDEMRRRIAAGDTADYAASRGEYLNGLIIAELLGYDFVDAADIVKFDGRGRYDPELTNDLVSERLRKHKKAVIPGFYGSMPDGRIKTFSRGGSDITGSIIARGVAADVYENWTDVSGLLMADPRIVDNPKPIEVVTYKELRELAYMGATVLHDEAIFPVRQAGIPVNIRNTNLPTDPGTMIVPSDSKPKTKKGSITGIAGRKDFTVITVEKALMNQELGFGRRILEVLERYEVSFEHIPTSIDTISIVVSDLQLKDKLEKILEEIRVVCKPDSVQVLSKMALLATVGRGMSHTPGMAAKLFAALADAGVNIRMIDQGSSELNIIVGIEASDFEKAMKAIYKRFVDGN
jgi:aspartate kinase